MQVRVQIEILLDAQILIQAEALRHVADPVLHLLRMSCYIDIEYPQRSAVQAQETRDAPHEGGFAGPVGPDQRRERTASRSQRYAVERTHD